MTPMWTPRGSIHLGGLSACRRHVLAKGERQAHDRSSRVLSDRGTLMRDAGPHHHATTFAPVIPPRAAKRIAAYLWTLAQRWNADLAGIKVALNPRLTRTVARFRPPASIIEISAAVVAMPADRLRDVLCHEAAHAVVWARHGHKARPHGPEWAALVRSAGHEPTASLIRCGAMPAPTRTTSRFRHTCLVCHFSAVASRRMPRWRCPQCRAIGLPGTLTVERIR